MQAVHSWDNLLAYWKSNRLYPSPPPLLSPLCSSPFFNIVDVSSKYCNNKGIMFRYHANLELVFGKNYVGVQLGADYLPGYLAVRIDKYGSSTFSGTTCISWLPLEDMQHQAAAVSPAPVVDSTAAAVAADKDNSNNSRDAIGAASKDATAASGDREINIFVHNLSALCIEPIPVSSPRHRKGRGTPKEATLIGVDGTHLLSLSFEGGGAEGFVDCLRTHTASALAIERAIEDVEVSENHDVARYYVRPMSATASYGVDASAITSSTAVPVVPSFSSSILASKSSRGKGKFHHRGTTSRYAAAAGTEKKRNTNSVAITFPVSLSSAGAFSSSSSSSSAAAAAARQSAEQKPHPAALCDPPCPRCYLLLDTLQPGEAPDGLETLAKRTSPLPRSSISYAPPRVGRFGDGVRRALGFLPPAPTRHQSLQVRQAKLEAFARRRRLYVLRKCIVAWRLSVYRARKLERAIDALLMHERRPSLRESPFYYSGERAAAQNQQWTEAGGAHGDDPATEGIAIAKPLSTDLTHGNGIGNSDEEGTSSNAEVAVPTTPQHATSPPARPASTYVSPQGGISTPFSTPLSTTSDHRRIICDGGVQGGADLTVASESTIQHHINATITVAPEPLPAQGQAGHMQKEEESDDAMPLPPLVGVDEVEAARDAEGRFLNFEDIARKVFARGCSPAVRRELWLHFIGIYHPKMTLAQRAQTDTAMALAWSDARARLHKAEQNAGVNGSTVSSSGGDSIAGGGGDSGSGVGLSEELAAHFEVIGLDVARCDPDFLHDPVGDPGLLRDILRAYVLTSSQHEYAQGMSDLLEPVLYVVQDAAVAFCVFVQLMARVCSRFDRVAERGIQVDLSHLRRLMRYCDPELADAICAVGADHLYFGYRWFLLDFKREFEREETLKVWDVLWSARVMATANMAVFVALAVLQRHRQYVLKARDFAELLGFFNHLDMSGQAKAVLSGARAIVQSTYRARAAAAGKCGSGGSA